MEDITLEYLKNNHQLIHYFGLGFIQIKLNYHSRIHVYTGDLLPITTETPHTHRYDFNSIILEGTLNEYLYKRSKTGVEYELRKTNCNSEDCVNSDIIEIVKLAKYKSFVYNKGERYFRDYVESHTVSSNDNCITLLRREFPYKKYAYITSEIGR